jgi:hypothetical protein
VETLDEMNKTDEDEEVNSDEFEDADLDGIDRGDEVSDKEDGDSSRRSKRYIDEDHEDDLLPIEKAAKKLKKRQKRDE